MPGLTKHTREILSDLIPGDLVDPQPGSRMHTIRQAIEDQLDMQHGILLRGNFDRAIAPELGATQQAAMVALFCRLFPFMRPDNFVGCDTYKEVAWEIFRRAS